MCILCELLSINEISSGPVVSKTNNAPKPSTTAQAANDKQQPTTGAFPPPPMEVFGPGLTGCRTGRIVNSAANGGLAGGIGLGKAAVGENISPAKVRQPSFHNVYMKLETPEKPKVPVRNLRVGQALVLSTGNSVYRLSEDIYLYVNPFRVAVHYSVDTLRDLEGHLAPLKSKLIIHTN